MVVEVFYSMHSFSCVMTFWAGVSLNLGAKPIPERTAIHKTNSQQTPSHLPSSPLALPNFPMLKCPNVETCILCMLKITGTFIADPPAVWVDCHISKLSAMPKYEQVG